MGKGIKHIGILFFVLCTLWSCTNESVNEDVVLLKRIVEVAVDGSTTTTFLNYNGVKIESIDKADAFLEFYYSGNLITKIVESNKRTAHKNTLDYSYVDGVLHNITSSDNYELEFKKKSDGSVAYEKWAKDANNVAIKVYYGTLYFENDNLVKDERVIDDAKKGIIATTILNTVFDNRNNALRHILGFDKLLDFAKTTSPNNSIVHLESYSEKHVDKDQTVSSIKRVENKIQYNSIGYPTEIVSENVVFGESDSRHLKSQLFYN